MTRCAESPSCPTFSRGPHGAARHTGICWGCGPGGQLGISIQGQSLFLEASRPPAVYLVLSHQGWDPGSFSSGEEGRTENGLCQPPTPTPKLVYARELPGKSQGPLRRPFLRPQGPLPASSCPPAVGTKGITSLAHIGAPYLCLGHGSPQVHSGPLPGQPARPSPTQRPSPDTPTRETRQAANGLRAAKGPLGPCFLPGNQLQCMCPSTSCVRETQPSTCRRDLGPLALDRNRCPPWPRARLPGCTRAPRPGYFTCLCLCVLICPPGITKHLPE